MNGWLIINGFLHAPKFDDLYRLLAEAFQAQGATLTVFPNTAFATPLTPLMALKPLKPEVIAKHSRTRTRRSASLPFPKTFTQIWEGRAPSRPGFAITSPDFVLFWDKDVALAQRLEAAGQIGRAHV